MVKRFLLALYLLVTLLNLRAQDQNYVHYTLRSGIPAGFIFKMIEDRYGYIWIATAKGLSRFDGYDFMNYLPILNDSTAIQGTIVTSVLDYDSTSLLVGTLSALNRFDRKTGHFRRIQLADSLPEIDNVGGCMMTKEGLWVLTRRGLFRIDPNTLELPVASGEFYAYEETPSNTAFYSGDIELGPDGMLWLGSWTQSLMQFDPIQKQFQPIPTTNDFYERVLRDNAVWSIRRTANDDMLVATDSGIVALWHEQTTPELIRELGETELSYVQSLTLDSQGRLLIGSGLNGGFRWDVKENQVEVFSSSREDRNSLLSNDIHYVFEDSHANLWFGHHNLGVSFMYTNNLDYVFKSFVDEFGKPSNNVGTFHVTEDEDGNLWFPVGEGLVYQPADNGPATLYPAPNTNGLQGSFVQEDKLFALSGDGNEIYRFDRTSSEFTEVWRGDSVYFYPMMTQLEDKVIIPALSDKLGVFDPSTERMEVLSVPSSEVRKGTRYTNINRDVEGNLLAEVLYVDDGWDFETLQFDPESYEFSRFDMIRLENSNNRTGDVTSRFEPYTFWNRSAEGLTKENVRTETSQVYFEGEPLIQEGFIGYVLEDADGYIWMNNATGIMRLDPITEEIRQFPIRNEYRPNVLNRAFQLRNGDILFTGQEGYLRFNPSRTTSGSELDQIYITGIDIGDQSFSPMFNTYPKKVSYADNDIALSFTALNFRDPQGTQYRYRVSGYNQDWTEVGNQRQVFLANLPSGSYAFEVEAGPRHGSFVTSASLSFEILAPWYRTTWAYALYGTLFVLLGYMGYRLQNAQIVRRERERSKDKELAQAREVQKAYDELKATQQQLVHSEKMASLGELTAGIAHEIQNPLNFVNNFSEVNKELLEEVKGERKKKKGERDENLEEEILNDIQANEEKIRHHGKRAEQIVKSMLQHSRSGASEKELTDINSLCDEYLRLAYHGFRAKDKSFNADFNADLDPNLPKIEVVPQDIGRVLLNIINNAFQALSAAATEQSEEAKEDIVNPQVKLITNTHNNSITITISDNGPGIPPDIRDKIFQPFFTTKPTGQGTGLGLSLSYDIVMKGHGGTIEVESKLGEGTRFVVTLPV